MQISANQIGSAVSRLSTGETLVLLGCNSSGLLQLSDPALPWISATDLDVSDVNPTFDLGATVKHIPTGAVGVVTGWKILASGAEVALITQQHPISGPPLGWQPSLTLRKVST